MRIHKVAAATTMAVMALGSLVLSTGGASAAPSPTGVVTASPNANLVDGQNITVTASQFGGATTLYVAECDDRLLSSQDPSYCDQTPADLVTFPATNGGGSVQFTVHTGANFHADHPGAVCDGTHACTILVSDSLTATDAKIVGVAAITFKDLRTATKTKVKSKKSAKAKSKVSFTATTTHTGGTGSPTGTVVFSDNGKKLGSVKEKASGKVTFKGKIKAGKNKITAVYSGDANFKPSTAKETVTGKKK